MTQPDTAKREPNDELFRVFDNYNWDGKIGRVAEEEIKHSIREYVKSDREQYAYEYARKVVGEPVEHKHLTRVYDQGCQDRDAINKHLTEQHNRNDQLRGKI